MKRLVIVSGYFNPIHEGHIRLLESAKGLGDRLLVIVNNDIQQKIKKDGKIIMKEDERMAIVKAIRYVDEVFLSIDEDRTVIKSLEKIAKNPNYSGLKKIFANGGDRELTNIPETQVCEENEIAMEFGIGGTDKPNSSSNINRLRGIE